VLSAQQDPIRVLFGCWPLSPSDSTRDVVARIGSDFNLVRRRGLEPLRCYPLAPQSNRSERNGAESLDSAPRKSPQDTSSFCGIVQAAHSFGYSVPEFGFYP
jgi:hypothetical protein